MGPGIKLIVVIIEEEESIISEVKENPVYVNP